MCGLRSEPHNNGVVCLSVWFACRCGLLVGVVCLSVWFACRCGLLVGVVCLLLLTASSSLTWKREIALGSCIFLTIDNYIAFFTSLVILSCFKTRVSAGSFPRLCCAALTEPRTSRTRDILARADRNGSYNGHRRLLPDVTVHTLNSVSVFACLTELTYP